MTEKITDAPMPAWAATMQMRFASVECFLEQQCTLRRFLGLSPGEREGAFPQYLERLADKTIGAGRDIYNVLGAVYPKLEYNLKKVVLGDAMNMLGDIDVEEGIQLGEPAAVKAVSNIDEPGFAADILINSELRYRPTKLLENYVGRLAAVNSVGDFGKEFFNNEKEKKEPESFFWLAYALSREDWGYNLPEVRKQFELHFPDFTERTKDAIGTIIHNSAMRDRLSNSKSSLNEGVAKRLEGYAAEWRSDIVTRIVGARDLWVYLDDKTKRMKNLSRLKELGKELPPPLPWEEGGSERKSGSSA